MTGERQTIRQLWNAFPMDADLLLATSADFGAGEPGHEHLDEALVARGIRARWVCWDDPSVDWTGALVAVRSTWDYATRREEFLEWAGAVPRLLNGADVFVWNTDKAYLVELASAGVPVVPTVAVDHDEDLPRAIASFESAVVKPRVGAGGRGVVLAADDPMFGPGPWVVQPLVESVRTEGEGSVFVLDGEVVSAAQKQPAAGEIRVHEQYGGTTVAVPVSEEVAQLARRTVAAAEELLGHPLDYARVDHLRLGDGTLAVSELEVTEPGLYLEELPGNGPAFADVVARRVHP
jgi:glutathione synthase/RimK-type ligase-like ATP-grasp enzyme